MTSLVPFETIITVRDGKRVEIQPGGAADFAPAEAERLLAAGTARLANSGDAPAAVSPAQSGTAVLAATRKRDTVADMSKAIEAGMVAAINAARSGDAPVKAAKAAKTKTADGDEDL